MDLTRELKEKQIGLGSLIEVTLFEGVRFNMISSSIPCAYRPEKPTNQPGERVAGYLFNFDVQRQLALELSPSTADVNIGGFMIYPEAVHSVKKYL